MWQTVHDALTFALRQAEHCPERFALIALDSVASVSTSPFIRSTCAAASAVARKRFCDMLEFNVTVLQKELALPWLEHYVRLVWHQTTGLPDEVIGDDEECLSAASYESDCAHFFAGELRPTPLYDATDELSVILNRLSVEDNKKFIDAHRYFLRKLRSREDYDEKIEFIARWVAARDLVFDCIPDVEPTVSKFASSKCFSCRKRGHIAAHCPSRSEPADAIEDIPVDEVAVGVLDDDCIPDVEPTVSKFASSKCYSCRKRGHIAAYCPSRSEPADAIEDIRSTGSRLEF